MQLAYFRFRLGWAKDRSLVMLTKHTDTHHTYVKVLRKCCHIVHRCVQISPQTVQVFCFRVSVFVAKGSFFVSS
uniref:Uncharacterized protein n=1 Tax=Anopheles quadriannulatus TaxID=34691 RepID=A0A182XQN2_ANOQN